MHTTHDPWDMHRYMSPSHTPNLVIIGPAIPDSLSGHFDTLHAARATRQPDLPNESNLVAVNFYRMGLPDSENRVELGCIVSEI